MSEVEPSVEIVRKKGVLGDITNTNGKRVRSMDSVMSSCGNKISKCQNGDKLDSVADKKISDHKDENGVVLSDNKAENNISSNGVVLLSLSDDKEKNDISGNDVIPFSTIEDRGKNDISRKINPTNQEMVNCEAGGELQDFFFHAMSSRTGADNVSDCLKNENLSSRDGKMKNSSESLVESVEIFSEDEETDSDDSARYSFHGGAASSTRNELNFLSTQESCVVSSDGPSSNVTPSESVFLGYSKQSAPGMENLLSDLSKCGESCKCSFCLKAAYMFSDLHYQDTRGRLSALKKSKRLARSLEGRISRDNNASSTTQGISKRSNDLDSDLTQRWRSLFFHSEDVLSRESSQLHTTLLMLKELRENCKKDLEMISVFPSNK